MSSASYHAAFDQKVQLDRLLEQAACERDRNKFLDLLREINRLRAERWLASGLKRPGVPPSNMNRDAFDIFAGPPDSDAGWLETVVGLERANERIHQLAAEAPGEYFAFHGRTHTIMIHLNSGARISADNVRRIA